ncbi:MAG: helix-turn-helix transcriptional regulator [Alphaproteobacteria bacterium]|nr:helix-turn-helix transcriptional regulator [Alphaproteobacteria bacterium]
MAKIPRPGRPVRGSTTGRPIMAVFDLLGRRWAQRVIWELREGQPTFRALRERCGNPSPSVLNTRLAELREAGVVETVEGGGYRLTEDGRRLLEALLPLHAWAERWAKRVSPG